MRQEKAQALCNAGSHAQSEQTMMSKHRQYFPLYIERAELSAGNQSYQDGPTLRIFEFFVVMDPCLSRNSILSSSNCNKTLFGVRFVPVARLVSFQQIPC